MSLAEAVEVFSHRQRAYADSIDQGLRDFDRLTRGERPESEQSGLEPWPDLLEDLAAWTPPRRKRVFDFVGASLALLLMAPLLLTIAIVIRLDSKGPVLFRQRRIGRHGRPFDILKFRTMRADEVAQEKYLASRSETGLFKITTDPRITRIGHFLRRYALDELPQLINVIRGEMSLVGPRPLVSEEAIQVGDKLQAFRYAFRPGITGPWQLAGPRATSLPFDVMLRYDYLYAARWSSWMDVKLLALTFRNAFRY